jgi:peptide chain release factor 2
MGTGYNEMISDEILLECSIEIYDPLPRGGQHVVGTPSGIKVTHTPSGLIAVVCNERSQHRNRQIALDMIMGGLTSPSYRG